MSSNAHDAVLARLDKDQDYLVDLTQKMVRVPTVNPKFEAGAEINREPEHQDLLQSVLDELGFDTEQSFPLPERPNLTGTWDGDEERSLILCGHVDVVPVGDRSLWTVDPFGAEIRDDRLYGRGSLDMKGGLAACVAACRALRLEGIELGGRLSVHAVVDEEAGGFGAMDLVKRGKLAQAAIIAEPTWGVINPSEGGLEWVRVTIRGKNAHAGWRYNSIYPQVPTNNRPEPGINALELGARFIEAVRELEREWGMRKYHPDLPPGITTINPGVMLAGAGLGPDGRPQVTTNPAIIPDVCVMEFDLKFLPSEDTADVRREFESFVHHWAQTNAWLRENPPRVDWEVGGLHFPPVDTPTDHPIIRSLIAQRERLGRESDIAGFIAVSDAAHYAGAGTTCVIYGPGGDGFHGIDEYIEIPSLFESAKVIAATILDWCGTR
ncbi:MAG: ArgE/DapE family deacylase [Alphaproteobacteria bacterium]